MMKKGLSCLFALVLALSLATTAFADVLWVPENRFLENHLDECEVHRRSYLVNARRGYVDLHAKPDGGDVTAQLKNGEQVYIYWVYEDFGYVSSDVEGWVAMEDLSVIYDHASFDREHEAEFLPYDRAEHAALLEGWAGETLALWPYPGAEQVELWEGAESTLETLREEDAFFHIWQDENGLTWGFRSYLYGVRNIWVCLDAPAGREEREIPVFAPPQAELYPAQEPQLPPVYGQSMMMVAAVVAVTAGALVVLKRKKK